jgi:hypothetical protein
MAASGLSLDDYPKQESVLQRVLDGMSNQLDTRILDWQLASIRQHARALQEIP